jgi:hypothetical protein
VWYRKEEKVHTRDTKLCPVSDSSAFRASTALPSTGMLTPLLTWLFLSAIPLPSSASFLFTSPRVCSSSVNGASSFVCLSCFSNPSAVSSAGVVQNIVSRKRSMPSSRVSVRRVDAKSIFCLTGAASGT